jgi:uncharacterized protein (TIGR02466 family)
MKVHSSTIHEIFKSYLVTNKVESKNAARYALNLKKQGIPEIISAIGGWQSETHYKPVASVKPVFESIDEDAKSLQRLLHLKKSPYLLAYWFNVNGKGHMNKPHNHMLFDNHRIIFSGVYYIQATEQQGRTIFENPNVLGALLYKNEVTKHNALNSGQWIYTPQNGVYLLFGADTTHYVEPNLTDKPRITMSFNYGFRNNLT